MLEALPEGAFHHSLAGLGRSLVQILSVAGECRDDFRGLRNGDPIVICGKIPPVQDEDILKAWGRILADSRLAFTFGYELTIDVKWAAQISREGTLTEIPDRIGSNQVVRSTRQVFRKVTAGEEVILLCNPAGTALAVESEIPDAALVSALRDIRADESRTDDSTASQDGTDRPPED